MDHFQGLDFDPVLEQDIEALTAIMKRAFDEDSHRHLGEPEGGPEGYDNGEFLRKYALHPASQAFKISRDNKLIGAFIVWIHANNVNYLGTIFLDPGLQDKGLGMIVWQFIERTYPETRQWRTDTPGFSKRNHHFYVNKCGFHVVKIEHPGNRKNESYLLEKDRTRTC